MEAEVEIFPMNREFGGKPEKGDLDRR